MGSVAVVCGNPRPESRTLTAARYLATSLTGGDCECVVDLATFGQRLLDPDDPDVAHAVHRVGAAELVIVASPTYKATYTGLLKVFLDRFAGGTGLAGVAVPLMLGGSPHHALAPELHLRPLLVELGAPCVTPALFVLDDAYDDPASYRDWLDRTAPVVRPLLDRLPRPTGVPA
ncbi:NAD(P)H-dependent oxidoreductase [Nocardioides sp. CBS4Y-1]|uniref:NAD(P)H-dependent oxidoreductase n=2 Tax=Nocardioides acrostichi TaxID=2784339 RepID=A0A930UV73_9ACTN|nr:NAD(P)H-dependent oxidoreductase [Nocardioides acrostichi]